MAACSDISSLNLKYNYELIPDSPVSRRISDGSDSNIAINCCDKPSFLVDTQYVSWGPTIEVTNNWLCDGGDLIVDVKHTVLSTGQVIMGTFVMKSFNGCKKVLKFKTNKKLLGTLKYLTARFINTLTYELIFVQNGVLSSAWMQNRLLI